MLIENQRAERNATHLITLNNYFPLIDHIAPELQAEKTIAVLAGKLIVTRALMHGMGKAFGYQTTS
jgi:hypothetical protein